MFLFLLELEIIKNPNDLFIWLFSVVIVVVDHSSIDEERDTHTHRVLWTNKFNQEQTKQKVEE